MGGSKSKSTKKHAKVAFTDYELKVLEKSMLPEFPENPDYSVKLNNRMRERCKNQQTDYTNFVITLELLLKEQQEYYLSDYKFQRINQQIFANFYSRFTASYSQGSIFIKERLNMFHYNKEIKNSQRNDLAATSVANSIFEQKSYIPFNQFIALVKQQLIYANKMCKQYFTTKFIDPYLKFEIPSLTSSSVILNDQALALLQMSSPDFNRTSQLDLKFSSSGTNDLEYITEIIIDSLLFLFRNREHESQNDTFQQQVF
ncbi:unnamed protein product [Paramecium octaurelia]|uniref:Uncharacterized protein n=1 Tax=Paramecium octaurelia TaxID=43137 RepID=A0A8S1WRQ2_PAROT|nr:unnamed protein product [Paramecium octaurelia]